MAIEIRFKHDNRVISVTARTKLLVSMQLPSYVINSLKTCYGNGQCNGNLGSNTDNREWKHQRGRQIAITNVASGRHHQ
jgi:hypothetical protein